MNFLPPSIQSKIRWLGCLIFFIAGCNSNNSYDTYKETREDSLARLAMVKRAFIQIHELKPHIRNGDLVTRTGNDFTSESLRSLNQRDKTFSHCGIISIENDSIFVYHALGGDFNPDQKIRRDPFEVFAEPYTNKGVGIFRFSVADSMRNAFSKTAASMYLKGIMFDMDFDLATDDRMYCAEYVCKCLQKAGNGQLAFNHSHIRSFEFIGVDDLFLHPMCKMMAQLVYK